MNSPQKKILREDIVLAVPTPCEACDGTGRDHKDLLCDYCDGNQVLYRRITDSEKTEFGVNIQFNP